MKKILAVLIFLVALLCYRLYAQSPALDTMPTEAQMALSRGEELSSCLSGGLLGGFLGFAALKIVGDHTIASSEKVPAHYEYAPNGGIALIPDSERPISLNVSAEPWTVAAGAVAGAAISVGIYELGHRVLKWW